LQPAFSNQSTNAQCHIDDWTALKALYESTDGDNWDKNDGWEVVKGEKPPANCDLRKLYGIDLNSSSRIERLQLYNNNLAGTIPPELQHNNKLMVTYLLK